MAYLNDITHRETHFRVNILPKFDDISDLCYNIIVTRQDTVTVGLEAEMNRQSEIEKWAALYVRLSRDDENEGDSNSISHQVEILTKYCRDHGILNYKIFKDDGYSGTSLAEVG